ncbi:unnamed protein product, partial [Ectocarpus fasciculatus]
AGWDGASTAYNAATAATASEQQSRWAARYSEPRHGGGLRSSSSSSSSSGGRSADRRGPGDAGRRFYVEDLGSWASSQPLERAAGADSSGGGGGAPGRHPKLLRLARPVSRAQAFGGWVVGDSGGVCTGGGVEGLAREALRRGWGARLEGLPVRAHVPRVRRGSTNLDRQHLRSMPCDSCHLTPPAQHPNGVVLSARGRFPNLGAPGVGGPREPRPAVPSAAQGALGWAVRTVGERRGTAPCRRRDHRVRRQQAAQGVQRVLGGEASFDRRHPATARGASWNSRRGTHTRARRLH